MFALFLCNTDTQSFGCRNKEATHLTGAGLQSPVTLALLFIYVCLCLIGPSDTQTTVLLVLALIPLTCRWTVPVLVFSLPGSFNYLPRALLSISMCSWTHLPVKTCLHMFVYVRRRCFSTVSHAVKLITAPRPPRSISPQRRRCKRSCFPALITSSAFFKISS